MWKLSIEDDEGNRTVVSLVRDEYSIGRAEDNTVRLTERNISRRHARLRRDSSAWLIEDTESYKGSFVNGTRISSAHRLQHADLLQLGDYKLIVINEAQAAELSDGGTAASLAGPTTLPLLDQPDRLVMLVGPTPGVEFPLLGARMIIGRGEDCDIALNHSSVSRIHAEIQALQDGRYEIIDRGSANGVRVNGVELGRALLDSRDTVELGDVVLKFIPAGDIYRFEADESHQLALRAAVAAKRSGSARPARGKLRLSLPVKIAASVLTLGVAGAIAAVALGLHEQSGTLGPGAGPEAVAERGDQAARTLALAVRQLHQGQIAAAHETASGLPADSNARQTGEFRRIEAAWADMIFEQSAVEVDLLKARELLDRVAKTPSVDTVRRRRAADQIARLDAKGLEVTDLPRQVAETRPPTSPSPAKPTGPEGAKAAARAGARSETPVAGFDSPPTSPTPTLPVASPTPPPQMVASGNLQQLTAAKEALKAKAKSGAATQQDKKLLTALCRQLGDTSCAQ